MVLDGFGWLSFEGMFHQMRQQKTTESDVAKGRRA